MIRSRWTFDSARSLPKKFAFEEVTTPISTTAPSSSLESGSIVSSFAGIGISSARMKAEVKYEVFGCAQILLERINDLEKKIKFSKGNREEDSFEFG